MKKENKNTENYEKYCYILDLIKNGIDLWGTLVHIKGSEK